MTYPAGGWEEETPKVGKTTKQRRECSLARQPTPLGAAPATLAGHQLGRAGVG